MPQSVPVVSVPSSPIDPSDLIDIEEIARRLHVGVGYVREKIRPRCKNPIPVFNVGRHLLFSWAAVSAWVLTCAQRPQHAVAHASRQKKAKAA